MTNIIDFEAAQIRAAEPISHPVVRALDALALALSEEGHEWSDQEVWLYETAISYFGCTDSGSSV